MVLVEPSWYQQATAIARAMKLPEQRIVVLPLGKVSANSVDALPLIAEQLPSIVAAIEQALQPGGQPC